jgi:hypothetical protein
MKNYWRTKKEKERVVGQTFMSKNDHGENGTIHAPVRNVAMQASLKSISDSLRDIRCWKAASSGKSRSCKRHLEM